MRCVGVVIASAGVPIFHTAQELIWCRVNHASSLTCIVPIANRRDRHTTVQHGDHTESSIYIQPQLVKRKHKHNHKRSPVQHMYMNMYRRHRCCNRIRLSIHLGCRGAVQGWPLSQTDLFLILVTWLFTSFSSVFTNKQFTSKQSTCSDSVASCFAVRGEKLIETELTV